MAFNLKKQSQNNAQMLDNLNKGYQHLYEVAQQALHIDMSQQTPEQQDQTVMRLKDLGIDVTNVGNTIQDTSKQMQESNKAIEDAVGNVTPLPKSASFNYKKAQDQMMNIPQGDPSELFKGLTGPHDVEAALDEIGDPNIAINVLLENYANDNQLVVDPHNPELQGESDQTIKDLVGEYFSDADPANRSEVATMLYEMIFPEGEQGANGENRIDTTLETNVKPLSASIVEQTNATIKKLATEHAKSMPKQASSATFNLKKQAQHKGLENTIMFGPEQTHIDAFTGQLISNWHLVERNKGFGLKVDDVLDIDFETIWRGNVMDKYFRPYRDKEGNWVDGYIESRFEVDKNIPSTNNYQLKPGETRRITPPEYGVIGARLEAGRNDMNKERGYSPSSKSEAYNWKKASSKSLIKESEMVEPIQRCLPYNSKKKSDC